MGNLIIWMLDYVSLWRPISKYFCKIAPKYFYEYIIQKQHVNQIL